MHRSEALSLVCEVALRTHMNERKPLNNVMLDLKSKSKVHKEVVLIMLDPSFLDPDSNANPLHTHTSHVIDAKNL